MSGRLGECDPELISTVMEYCLQTRCRSEPIFEAVAENFVCHAERHTTLQIAKQIVAMGRLNYLPQVSAIYNVTLHRNQKTKNRRSTYEYWKICDRNYGCICKLK